MHTAAVFRCIGSRTRTSLLPVLAYRGVKYCCIDRTPCFAFLARLILAQSSVSAMGHNPRAVGVGDCRDGGGSLPLQRTAYGLFPSKERVLAVLMQVLFFGEHDYRDRVKEAFRSAVLQPPLPPVRGVDDNICSTPVLFFRAALDSVGFRVVNVQVDKRYTEMWLKTIQQRNQQHHSTC